MFNLIILLNDPVIQSMEESYYAGDQAKISPFRSNNTIKPLLFWRPKKDVKKVTHFDI